MRHSFAEFELNTATLELRQADIMKTAEPLILDILRVLITNRHQVMSKDELIREVWQGQTSSPIPQLQVQKRLLARLLETMARSSE